MSEREDARDVIQAHILERIHAIKEILSELKDDIKDIKQCQHTNEIKIEKLETAFKIKSGIFGVLGGFLSALVMLLAKIFDK